MKHLDLARFTIEDLQDALRFFDCDRLRGYYTGLIADLRRELRERGRAMTTSVVGMLFRRIDEIADRRERRASDPLGVGYYTKDVRDRAKALAASMLAAAEGHGVTLDILDGVTDLAMAALDSTSDAVSRARREARR